MYGSVLDLTEDDLIDLREFVGSTHTVKVIVSDGSLSNDDYMTITFSLGAEPPLVPGFASVIAPPTTWEEWAPAGNDLDISNRRSPSFVQNALGKFDGQWALTTIPSLNPGDEAPGERVIIRDAAAVKNVHGKYGAVVLEGRMPLATPAQIARINIRANLQRLKQTIVDEISAVYAATPPRRFNGDLIPFTQAQLDTFANNVADRYIKEVDSFLGTHPGAKPTLGERIAVLDWIGFQNEFNSPWCAHWAEAIQNSMSLMPVSDYGAAFSGSGFGVEASLDFRYVQWNKSKLNVAGTTQIQHNWVAVRAAGYPNLLTLTQTALNGQSLIYFDPWWDILPRIRRPGDHSYLLTDWTPIP